MVTPQLDETPDTSEVPARDRQVPRDPVGSLDPRVARSRARLLAAATDLLVEGGPAAVTVDAVAERSGVAKSTLYRHWPSRTNLLFDVMRSHMPVVEAPDAALDFAQALRRVVDEVVRSLTGPRWVKILPALLTLQRHSPELAALVAEDRTCRAGVLGEVFDRGIAEGRLAERPDLTRATQLLIGPLVLAALTGDEADLPALADEVVSVYLAAHPRPPASG